MLEALGIMEANAETLPTPNSPYSKLEKVEAQVQKIVDTMEANANANAQLFLTGTPYKQLEAQMEKLQKTVDIMEANAEPLCTGGGATGVLGHNGELEAQVEELQASLDT